PGSPLTQAVWYEIVGFGVIAMRALSILWGALALVAWFVIARQLSRSDRVVLLTCGLLVLDYPFIRGAAHGRMDMQSAALGFAAFAVYLTFRERHLTRALLLSHSLAAASFFTHPNGILPFAGLLVLTVLYDLRRLRWYHLPTLG